MTMMMYAGIFSFVNIILLSVLLHTYVQNYKMLKARFSLGLILFASVFLVQKFVTLYIFLFVMLSYEDQIGIYMFILEVISTVAFTILVKITIR